jgi:hypothetical protein
MSQLFWCKKNRFSERPSVCYSRWKLRTRGKPVLTIAGHPSLLSAPHEFWDLGVKLGCIRFLSVRGSRICPYFLEIPPATLSNPPLKFSLYCGGRAIVNNALTRHFQPQIDINTFLTIHG